MKTDRNRLLKKIRRRVMDLRMQQIQAKVKAVDQFKDSAKQFEAIRIVKEFGRTNQKLVVNNDEGDRIMDDVEAAEYVRSYFVSQFSDPTKAPLEAHPPNPKPLDCPIRDYEVKAAVKKLKNRRAVGLDGLNAELLKNGPPVINSIIALLLNTAMAHGEEYSI